MEAGPFINRDVQDAFRKFVVVELHNDHQVRAIKSVNAALQQRLTSNATAPQYVVIDPASEAVLSKWAYLMPNVVDNGWWVERLNEAASRYVKHD